MSKLDWQAVVDQLDAAQSPSGLAGGGPNSDIAKQLADVLRLRGPSYDVAYAAADPAKIAAAKASALAAQKAAKQAWAGRAGKAHVQADKLARRVLVLAASAPAAQAAETATVAQQLRDAGAAAGRLLQLVVDGLSDPSRRDVVTAAMMSLQKLTGIAVKAAATLDPDSPAPESEPVPFNAAGTTFPALNARMAKAIEIATAAATGTTGVELLEIAPLADALGRMARLLAHAYADQPAQSAAALGADFWPEPYGKTPALFFGSDKISIAKYELIALQPAMASASAFLAELRWTP